jgi:hypothetical protein
MSSAFKRASGFYSACVTALEFIYYSLTEEIPDSDELPDENLDTLDEHDDDNGKGDPVECIDLLTQQIDAHNAKRCHNAKQRLAGNRTLLAFRLQYLDKQKQPFYEGALVYIDIEMYKKADDLFDAIMRAFGYQDASKLVFSEYCTGNWKKKLCETYESDGVIHLQFSCSEQAKRHKRQAATNEACVQLLAYYTINANKCPSWLSALPHLFAVAVKQCVNGEKPQQFPTRQREPKLKGLLDTKVQELEEELQRLLHIERREYSQHVWLSLKSNSPAVAARLNALYKPDASENASENASRPMKRKRCI